MFKKIISIALVVMMVLSVAVIAVSAADVNDSNVGADGNNSAGADTSNSGSGDGSTIYFDASAWKNFNTIFCHIWVRGGDAFFSWQSKKEACKKESDGKFSYDLSRLNDSKTVSGGLKDGTDYCVIFSANTGVQAYDTTFGRACIGDTAKLTGNKVENPVDSEKEAFEAVWTTNSSSYGPHLAISSIGNIIGSKLCPNEKGTEVIGDWLPTYYKSTSVNATEALSKAFPRFGITDASQIEVIGGYIIQKETGEDEDAMLKILADAFAKAYPAKKDAVKDVKELKEKAEKDAKEIKSNGGHVTSGGSGSGSSGSGSSGSGSSSSGSGSSNSSGSGSDGQEDTMLIILGGVMLAAAGVMFISRKKREE